MLEQELLDVFTSAVAPPLAIAAAGYVLGRWREIDVEPLSTVTVYLLMPALVFHSLVTMPVGGDTAFALVTAMVGFTAVMAVTTAAVGRLAGETGSVLSGATLAAAFPNVGNFGIPVATFAFGDIGRTTAVVFVLVQNVLLYTVGVYLLSSSGAGGDRTAAVERVLTLPVTYAVLAAGVALAFDPVPAGGPSLETIGMVGDASIPLFLIILGIQLADMNPGRTIKRVVPTVGVKLLIAPIVAVVIALLIGIGDLEAGRAFVVLAAGPAAVTPLVLTIEFTDDQGEELSAADYVGSVVLFTIFGCLPIVTGLILTFDLFL
ncbi:AEC family transporter [Halomontanus rarus]|uniref:AEC family transporter n=1 Tax=Halomontanus rarus TaxID=3034020 RepID=UPI001A9819C8